DLCMSVSSPFLPPPPHHLLQGAALFLDFDGTLVELAPTPDAARVHDRLINLLSLLSERLQGRLAIISGRPVAGIREFLPLRLAAVRSHAMEFGAADGAIELLVRPAALHGARAARTERSERTPATLGEGTPHGAVMHYQ